MSRFKIYRTNYYDPIIIGKKIRHKAFLYIIILTIFTLLLVVFSIIFRPNRLFPFILIIPSILTIIYIFLNLRSKKNNIKTIGEIEFTRTGIIKRISDFKTHYEFQSIKEIELQGHIPVSNIVDSKSGYITYILTIIFIDSMKESLVVSDKPLESKQDISIIDTMNTLKKLIPEIEIKIIQ